MVLNFFLRKGSYLFYEYQRLKSMYDQNRITLILRMNCFMFVLVRNTFRFLISDSDKFALPIYLVICLVINIFDVRVFLKLFLTYFNGISITISIEYFCQISHCFFFSTGNYMKSLCAIEF